MKLIYGSHKQIIYICFAIVFLALLLIFVPDALGGHYLLSQNANSTDALSTTSAKIVFVPTYVPAPEVVKGIYMTSWVASDPSLRGELVKLLDGTELNTVVIDIKDYSGKIVFPIEDNPALKAYGSEEVRVKDLPQFIESLHKKGIYVIARVAVFQDAYFVKFRPDLAVKNASGTEVWKDKKGISWIDAGSREYWDYIVLLAEEARKIGFDEVNFDYIRFPSDGNMEDISYPWSSTTPKATVLRNFFQYLHENLFGSGLKTSADLFGMTTTATNDMGIGQVLENALPYFDYIDPMVYPSHYPPTFEGFALPEAHPYDVVHFEMQSAVARAMALSSTSSSTVAVLRPWLQDFGLKMDYGPAEVRAQIKATNDVGLSSWILWSASNKYTAGALNTKQ
jgi:hypothetical protein